MFSMIVAATYTLALAAAYSYFLIQLAVGPIAPELATYRVGLTSAIVGGLGGCVYCLRGIYLNYAVRRQWGAEWLVWYFLRPVVSAACGAVSYLFLRAGLLILEAGQRADASELGFYALAFIAGLNVDKFLSKIEDIAQAVWGIEKSRSAGARDDTKQS